VSFDLGSQLGTLGLAPVALGQCIWSESERSLRPWNTHPIAGHSKAIRWPSRKNFTGTSAATRTAASLIFEKTHAPPIPPLRSP